MAINNFQGSRSLPAWAKRGYFREAGSYEGPSEMAKALLSGRWNFTPEQLYRRVKAYDGNELIDRMKRDGVTMVRLVWSPGFSHAGDECQWRIVREMIPKIQRKGMKMIAYLSVTNSFWQEMFTNEPAAKAWKQVRFDGGDVPYMAAIYPGVITRILMCVNQQGWRDYVKYKITKALEAGADGLFFDNLFSNCYCPTCRAKFGDYTERLYGQRYDIPEPEPAHGPKDVGTTSGIEVVADSDRSRSEVRPMLSLARTQFWNDSVADFMAELYAHAQSIKPDVVFYPNGHERWPMNVPCNLKLSEDQKPITWAEGGPMWTNVALWKYLYEDGGREKPALNGAHDERMWAEILAFGCDPIGRVSPEWNAWHARYGRKLYADVQPAGLVGLLMRSLSPIPEKSPVVTLLARRNVQFDVIVYEMMLERYDLARYQLLLANDVRFVSDEVCQQIRQYVRSGGTLIATGPTSLFTETWQERGDYGLADLFGVSYRPDLTGRYEQACGRGRVIFYPQSMQDAANQNNNPALLEQWLGDVQVAQGLPTVRVDAPDGVLASVWLRTRPDGQASRGHQRIVHLVNYRGEPVRDVRVTVPGPKAAKVELLSPEAQADLTPRDVVLTPEGVAFTVPVVGVYTVAVVG